MPGGPRCRHSTPQVADGQPARNAHTRWGFAHGRHLDGDAGWRRARAWRKVGLSSCFSPPARSATVSRLVAVLAAPRRGRSPGGPTALEHRSNDLGDVRCPWQTSSVPRATVSPTSVRQPESEARRPHIGSRSRSRMAHLVVCSGRAGDAAQVVAPSHIRVVPAGQPHGCDSPDDYPPPWRHARSGRAAAFTMALEAWRESAEVEASIAACEGDLGVAGCEQPGHEDRLLVATSAAIRRSAPPARLPRRARTMVYTTAGRYSRGGDAHSESRTL